MSDLAILLTILQLGDSAFPSGGFAFSWGLEGLAADGLIETPEDVREVSEGQLSLRWNLMDRVLLRRAHGSPNIKAVAAVDHLAEAATLALPMRTGSRRAGRALLGVCARLGQREAIKYREAANEDPRLGHLPVVQGVVFREAGLSLATSELLSGWMLISGLANAAVRLGLLGHLDAQALITSLRPTLVHILSSSSPPPDTVSSFTPLTDIAISRHTSRHLRIFAT